MNGIQLWCNSDFVGFTRILWNFMGSNGVLMINGIEFHGYNVGYKMAQMRPWSMKATYLFNAAAVHSKHFSITQYHSSICCPLNRPRNRRIYQQTRHLLVSFSHQHFWYFSGAWTTSHTPSRRQGSGAFSTYKALRIQLQQDTGIPCGFVPAGVELWFPAIAITITYYNYQ